MIRAVGIGGEGAAEIGGGEGGHLANNGPDDVGQGRLLPAVSVDQYGATLASWFGVANGSMSTALPNIVNYNPSTWNLGFV